MVCSQKIKKMKSRFPLSRIILALFLYCFTSVCESIWGEKWSYVSMASPIFCKLCGQRKQKPRPTFTLKKGIINYVI